MTTLTKLDELNQAELPARQLLEQLGWIYVPREMLIADRSDEQAVLLKSRLKQALLRLNEWMTGEQAEQTISKLEHLDNTGMTRNQAVHEYLTYGMPLHTHSPSGSQTRIVRFFDFDCPEDGLNEFVVTTQFSVRRSHQRGETENNQNTIIPDLVLFVNGIPLVVMEAKSPTLFEEWRSQAVDQLCRYQETRAEWQGRGAPELFHYNLLCVAHCGAAAVFAAPGATDSAYSEWKSVFPLSDREARDRYAIEPQGQEQLIIGLLTPTTLLEILRDFVVYEPEQGHLVKKLPRYQQYRAVRAILERILTGRGGVVWHTQGSGKSLTMLWVAVKLYRESQLRNPSIVVVSDRTQLDRQIAQTFQRCGFPAPEQASDTRELRRLLLTGIRCTVMTTLQKFEEVLAAPEGGLDVLNPSENVIVMVDEAHRTQYGALGARMSQALPNAKLIGFTGTPINKGFRRNTMGRFGPLIDTYTIPQSVADGATVPILYQARLPELALEGPENLDDVFEALFSDKPEDVKAKLVLRFANKETLASAGRRLQMIALDITRHFKGYVRPNGFKAQVVAPSRSAALDYARHLNDFGVTAYPIITTHHNDGAEFQEARQLDQEQVVNAFVDPRGEPEILVVVDMLLTGFDAPVEQVLYLDRPLREHGLLQAIARVNRPFSHIRNGVHTTKHHGLVLDYCGISQNLEEALSTFDGRDRQEAMQLIAENPATVVEAVAVKAESHFNGLDLNNTWACVEVFAPDKSTEGSYKADLFESFRADYRAFARLMDRFLPDPRALAYRDRLARLTAIHAFVRAQYGREDQETNWAELGAKVKDLVGERIEATVRPLMKPVSILDSDFEQKIAALPDTNVKASVMEHAIRAQVHERLFENPVFYERISVQLSHIIEALHQRLISSVEACQRYLELKQQIRQRADFALSQGLSTLSMAIYELIDPHAAASRPGMPASNGQSQNQAPLDKATGDLACDLEKVVDEHRKIVDWQSNIEVQREMRRDIKRRLRNTGQFPEARLELLASQMVAMARQQPVP